MPHMTSRVRASGEGQLRADDLGEALGDGRSLFLGVGLDHDAHEVLGAARAEQDAAAPAELGLGLGDGGDQTRRGLDPVLVDARRR